MTFCSNRKLEKLKEKMLDTVEKRAVENLITLEQKTTKRPGTSGKIS